jgi:superfamily II DNA or RNA helicase
MDALLVPNQPVRVRGRAWTLTAREPSHGCASIRLRGIDHDRTLTLLTPFDRPRPLGARLRPRIVGRRRGLHELDRALLSIHPFGALPAAASAPLRLLPYQLEPGILVARDGASRVLIADGVGLGKTVQAGLVLLELVRQREDCRALVLAPAGLREQWRSELQTRLGLPAVLADAGWLRSPSPERPAHINPWSLPGIYVASHDLVKRPEVLRPLEDVAWDAVVIDEAHAATIGTDRRAALHAIARRSRHVVLLTATPHDGDPHERDALCDIGRGARDEPVVMFRRTRADVRESGPRRTRVLAVAPSPAERRMHDLLERYSRRVWDEAGARGDERARLVSIVLRKRALSSARSLQLSIERRLALLADAPQGEQLRLPLGPERDDDPVADDAPANELGAPGLADARREREWLVAIAAAAMAAVSDERKVHRLQRLLTCIDEPVIVFTEYRDTLARLAERLASTGATVRLLHGGLSAGERAAVQRAFNDRGGWLLATDAASEGLNLHHRCRTVVHFELPWNPSRLEQRAGRVDRMGQTRAVHELALVAAHTGERLVLAPLALRLAAAGATGRRTLGALSESSVAEAVMTGAPLPAALEETRLDPNVAAPPPGGLARVAEREAGRLERHRELAARSGTVRGAVRRAVPTTTVRTRAVAPGLYFVYAVSLGTIGGSPAHADPCVIKVDLARGSDGWSPARSRRELRQLVAGLASHRGTALNTIACEHHREVLDEVAASVNARHGRVRQRAETIRQTLASDAPLASRLLVQAGLFDRRALRVSARRAAALADFDSGSTAFVAADEPALPLLRDAELLAAIHVTSGS